MEKNYIKLKQIFKKLIIILSLMMVIAPKIVYADDGSTIWGILFEPVLIMMTAVGDGAINLLQSMMMSGSSVAVTSSFKSSSANYSNIQYGIYPILSNQIPILNPDFLTNSGSNLTDEAQVIRKQVAKWFVQLRNLTILFLAVVLAYIGIRMIMSSTGQDKAKYKKMFNDWLFSVVILFALIFMISLMFYATNTLTSMISTSTSGDTMLQTVRSTINTQEKQGIVFGRFGNVFLYLILIYLTAMFTLKYLKRVVYLAFLILISPLITITYSIDKVKDGKAQAFGNWFKEFFYNLLVQPIDLLIYTVLVTSALDFINDNILYGIIAVSFIVPAERFIESLFAIKPKHGAKMGEKLAGLALVTTAVNKMGSAAGNISKRTQATRAATAKLKLANANSQPTTSGGSSGSGNSGSGGSNSGTGGSNSGTGGSNSGTGGNNSGAGGTNANGGTNNSNSNNGTNQNNSGNSSWKQTAIKGAKMGLGVAKFYGKSLTTMAGMGLGAVGSIATGNYGSLVKNMATGASMGYGVGNYMTNLTENAAAHFNYNYQALKQSYNARQQGQQQAQQQQSSNTPTPPPVPSPNNGSSTPPPVPNQSNGANLPPLPNQSSGSSTPPPAPSQSSGTSTPPPAPNQSSGTNTPPPVPNQSSGTNTPPPVPNQSSGTNTPPPVPNQNSGANTSQSSQDDDDDDN